MSDQQKAETKLAFLERAHEELSDVLLAQQRQIDRLSRVVDALSDKLDDLAADRGGNGAAVDEKPPHY